MRKLLQDLQQESGKIGLSIVGAFLYAAGLNLFVVPAGLYTGGFMGIAQLIRTLLVNGLHLPLQNFDIAGIVYYLLNIPVFIIAFTKIGKRFFVKTMITVTAMTIFLSIIPTIALLPDDVLAASLIGGLVSGYGLGLALKMGSSSGGMDVIGIMMIRSPWHFSVGKANLVVNVALYAIYVFIFDIPTVIYSVIFAAIHSFTIDSAHAQNINVEASVITKKSCPEMEQEIFNKLGRGITRWQSTGAYTNEQSQVLYIMLSKYEEHELRNIIEEYDPDAFIVFNEGVSVFGHFLKKL